MKNVYFCVSFRHIIQRKTLENGLKQRIVNRSKFPLYENSKEDRDIIIKPRQIESVISEWFRGGGAKLERILNVKYQNSQQNFIFVLKNVK